MKYFGYSFAFLVGVALGIGSIVLTMCMPSTVRVDVHNESGQPVSNVMIAHENGTVSIHTLASGATQVIPVLVEGENSYSIQATLAKGDVVQGQEVYVEPGYHTRETITEKGIEHEMQSFY